MWFKSLTMQVALTLPLAATTFPNLLTARPARAA